MHSPEKARATISTQDKPLKKDHLHPTQRRLVGLSASMMLNISAVINTILSLPEGRMENVLIYLAGISFLRYASWQRNQSERIKEAHSVTSPSDAYRADRYVYKGPGLELGDTKLATGDNFYHILLPNRQTDGDQPLTPEQMTAVMDFNVSSLREIQQKIETKNYQAVVIKFGNELVGETITPPGTKTASKREVFARRNIHHEKNVEQPCIVLSRQAFEAMTLDQKDDVMEAVQALREDSRGQIVAEKIDAYRETRVKGLPMDEVQITNTLERLFLHEITALYGNHMLLFDKDPQGTPIKKRIPAHIERRVVDDVTYIVQVSDDYRTVEVLPIDLDKKISDVIAGQEPEKIALLTYYILQHFEELKEHNDEDSNDIRETFSNLGLLHQVNPPSVEPHYFKNHIKGLLAGVVATIALTSGPGMIHSDRDAETTNAITTSHRPDLEAPSGERSIQWRVENHNMEEDGYYITSIAYLFATGNWQSAKEQPTRLEVSRSIDTNLPHITLKKNVTLDIWGKAALELPVKNLTTIGALSITDQEGNTIDYDAQKYENGTIDVTIDRGLLHGFDMVKIEEILVPSADSVHATTAMHPLDWNRLSPEAKTMYQRTSNLVSLLSDIKTHKLYSVAPDIPKFNKIAIC